MEELSFIYGDLDSDLQRVAELCQKDPGDVAGYLVIAHLFNGEFVFVTNAADSQTAVAMLVKSASMMEDHPWDDGQPS